MAERFDHDPNHSIGLGRAMDLEAKRIAYASRQIAAHAERELLLLERATQTPDPDVARALEYQAGAAHRDFIAMTEEHALDR